MNKIKLISLLAAAAVMTGSVAMAETYSATGNGYHGEMTVNVTIDVATPFELTRSVTLSSIDAPSYCAAMASTSARASTYFSSPTNVFALRLTKIFVSKKASGSSRTDSVMSTQLRQTSNLLLFCLSIMPDPPSAAK